MNSTHPPSISTNYKASGSPFSTETKIGLTLAYILIFITALFGNSIGLYVVSTKAPSRRITDLLIKNLAIADLIFTVTLMPGTVLYIYFGYHRWFGGTIGTITCKVVCYAIPVSIAASVITLTIISIDRFCAIYFPLNLAVFRKHKTITTIIWFISILAMTPNLLFLQVSKKDDGYSCSPNWPWSKDQKDTFLAMRALHIFGFIVLYALPLLIIAVFNSLVARRVLIYKSPGNTPSFNRNAVVEVTRRKVVKMLSIIVIVFAFCWLPTYVNHYFMYFKTDDWDNIPIVVRHLMFWVSHANSAINPVLYIAFNKKFRYAFLDAAAALCASPFRVTSACMAYILDEQSTQDQRQQNEQPARQIQGNGFRVVPVKSAVRKGTGKSHDTRL